MVRVSLRRTLGYIVGVTAFSIFLINMHTRFVVLMANDIPREGRSSHMTHIPELTDSTDDEPTHKLLISPTVRITSHRQSNTHLNSIVNNTRLWFMPQGKARPTASPVGTGRKLALFPGESDGDRIANQLMFIPDGYRNDSSSGRAKLKNILFYNGLGSWPGVRPGRNQFLKQGCPINTCTITTAKTEARDADAILFKDYMPSHPSHYRPREQVWILYLLECPLHTPNYRQVKAVNWTATYRYDSDIVTPYEKWVYYDNRFQKNFSPKNYANKTKQVAWFVSNCHARNKRLQYAQELKKFINVDIYGACGTKKCSRSNHKACFKMLSDEYKFYLAFENSNCKDYITEKFFINGLRNDVLPIVMGAPPEDYAKVSPHKSFIHVDQFASPKELAKYLHYLDKNDQAYNEYFQWKGMGTFINTYFFCRLCSMLHVEDRPQKHYENINEWWRGPGTCISDSWRTPDPNSLHGNKVQ